MPPRYSYWTILAGGLPTAFRAAERADLLPTFNRIKEKHPDAEMKWFARGRLWASPDESLADLQRARTRRDRDWRPGGNHRDPRQAFKTTRKRDDARRDKTARQSGPPDEPPRETGRHEQPARDSWRRDQPARDSGHRDQARRRSSSKAPHASTRAASARQRGARPPKRRPR
jgi:hypothetical protein